MGRFWLVVKRTFLRIAAPALLLGAVTVAVFAVRDAIRHTASATPPPAHKRTEQSRVPLSKRVYYRIRYGDTLGQIAERFHTSIHQLLLFNPGLKPESIVPGERIRVR